MCGKKEQFPQLDELVRGEINFGSKSKVLIMGKVNIKTHFKDDTDVTIVNVFFVPNLFENLLSMRHLTQKGHIITISNGVCTLSDKNKKMITKVHKEQDVSYVFSRKNFIHFEDNNERQSLVLASSFQSSQFSWVEAIDTEKQGNKITND